MYQVNCIGGAVMDPWVDLDGQKGLDGDSVRMGDGFRLEGLLQVQRDWFG